MPHHEALNQALLGRGNHPNGLHAERSRVEPLAEACSTVVLRQDTPLDPRFIANIPRRCGCQAYRDATLAVQVEGEV